MRKGQLVAAYIENPDGPTWLMVKIEKKQSNGKYVVIDEEASDSETERYIVDQNYLAIFPNTTGPYNVGEHVLAQWKEDDGWTTALYDAEIKKVNKNGLLSLQYQEADEIFQVNLNRVTKYPPNFSFEEEEEIKEEKPKMPKRKIIVIMKDDEPDLDDDKSPMPTRSSSKKKNKKNAHKTRRKPKLDENDDSDELSPSTPSHSPTRSNHNSPSHQQNSTTSMHTRRSLDLSDSAEDDDEESHIMTRNQSKLKKKEKTVIQIPKEETDESFRHSRSASRTHSKQNSTANRSEEEYLEDHEQQETNQTQSTHIMTRHQQQMQQQHFSSSSPTSEDERADQHSHLSTPLPSSPHASPPTVDESSEEKLQPSQIQQIAQMPALTQHHTLAMTRSQQMMQAMSQPKEVEENREVTFIFKRPQAVKKVKLELLTDDDIAKLIPPPAIPKREIIKKGTPLLDCLTDPDLFEQYQRHTTASGMVYRKNIEEEREFSSALMQGEKCGRIGKIFQLWKQSL